jgi:2-haloacid dehalogenase
MGEINPSDNSAARAGMAEWRGWDGEGPMPPVSPWNITSLARRPRVVVFDAYGTLFDVHSAVMRHEAAIGPQARALSALWRAKQLEYSWVLSLVGDYRDFWQLTQEALDHALAAFPAVDTGLRPDLLGAYRVLDAYPEARGVLERLRAAGFATAILSNGEPAMLADAAASSGLGAALDAILSVESVRVFKTAPAAYRLVTSHFGCAAGEVLFVSSNRWDVAGAAAFGFTPLWINRAGNPPEYPGLEPVATLPDLTGVR